MQESVKWKTSFIHTQRKLVLNILITYFYMLLVFAYLKSYYMYMCLYLNFPLLILILLVLFSFIFFFLLFFFHSFFLGNRNLTLFWNEFGYQGNKDMEKSSDSIQCQRRQAMAIPCMIQCGEY